MDVGLDYENSSGRVGIECKLFEPYRPESHRLAACYLALPGVWDDIRACRLPAERLVSDASSFKRLDPAQLLRHLLGLKYGRRKEEFRLLYLYLDAPGSRRYDDLVIAGFSFTGEAQAIINENPHP